MKKLSLDQMVTVQGGGCLGYFAGVLTMIGGAATGNIWAVGAGFLVSIDNASSCVEQLS